MSGSRSTVVPVASTMAAPRPICTKGKAMRVIRATEPDTTTARSSSRTVSIRCIGQSARSGYRRSNRPKAAG